MNGAPLILASASPRRKALLDQIGVKPDKTIAAEIDETPKSGELAHVLVARLAKSKAEAIASKNPNHLVLGSDTVVAIGRRILPKPEDKAEATKFLHVLSGRAHKVLSGVALVSPGSSTRIRVVSTRVKVRNLDRSAIDEYVDSREWEGKAGAYAIQGLFAKHVISIAGSYTNIVGLPLFETANLLSGAGYRT